MQNYQSTFTVPSPTTDQTWDCEIMLLAHPVLWGYAHAIPVSGTSSWAYLQNTQVPGTTASDKCTRFAGDCERYRLAYWGVTAYLDAPALANQGTVVAAQYPLMSRHMAVYSVAGSTEPRADPRVAGPVKSVPGRAASDLASLVDVYAQPSRDPDTLQSMPNAYMGLAKDGVYCPGRLGNGFNKFRNTQDRRMYLGFTSASNQVGEDGTGLTMAVLPAASGIEPPLGATTVSSVGPGSGIQTRCIDGVMQITFRNLSPSASLTLFARYGIEQAVLPGSPISAFQRIPPKHDPVAMEAVSLIQRELKDAYPSEYNDFSRLLKVIRDVAGFIPWAPAQFVSKLAGTGHEYLEQRKLTKTNPRDSPPAAAVQEARDQSHSGPPRKPLPKPPVRK